MCKIDIIILIYKWRNQGPQFQCFAKTNPLVGDRTGISVPSGLPIIHPPPEHHHLIVFFIALNFAGFFFSFFRRSYFDARKGLSNVILTFLMCLIFVECGRDFRQFSYRQKWMSCWITQASFCHILYQRLHLSFFFALKFKGYILNFFFPWKLLFYNINAIWH